MPVEVNPPGASSQISRMSFCCQGEGNRTGIGLMALLGKCSVINRQRAGWCCPCGFAVGSIQGTSEAYSKNFSVFCLKDSNLWIIVTVPSLESGLGGTREIRILENSWEEFDLAQLIIKKTPTHTYEKWKCYSGIKSEAVSTE